MTPSLLGSAANRFSVKILPSSPSSCFSPAHRRSFAQLRNTKALIQYANRIPKAELHVHVEGTLYPSLLHRFANRNGIPTSALQHKDPQTEYEFEGYSGFIDLYSSNCQVLVNEPDFYELTRDYFVRARQQGIRHAEVFCDPQLHTRRGVPISTIINGICNAMDTAETEMGVSGKLILCYFEDGGPHGHRRKGEMDPIEELRSVQEDPNIKKDRLAGIGGYSYDPNAPYKQLKPVYEYARSVGLKTVVHAGEYGPASSVREAIKTLRVDRVDHGVRSAEDLTVLRLVERTKTPLTVCPLSNVRLGFYESLQKHPLRMLMQGGCLLTLNSDDPAYIGASLSDNFRSCIEQLHLSRGEIKTLAINSVDVSFASDARKEAIRQEIEKYDSSFNMNL
ncbi:unnamed protein product [Vitrella brassicaformis CCMP3155]|uniref:Adenosine deaminase domain-containing protein n=2 Tax=Vitrella brassicaformis TaxID=1169539 RepID=A0A0G4G789_VITBC|nr:unnamed protein product [Vitrella brassicaformis CCMP3155]|eukprot:CEM24100.1 unnamed protein product [Vitrella brassicaformis CCMP3155]